MSPEGTVVNMTAEDGRSLRLLKNVEQELAATWQQMDELADFSGFTDEQSPLGRGKEYLSTVRQR
eukprot:3122666-Prorocentrum_lima.AAC.1